MIHLEPEEASATLTARAPTTELRLTGALRSPHDQELPENPMLATPGAPFVSTELEERDANLFQRDHKASIMKPDIRQVLARPSD